MLRLRTQPWSGFTLVEVLVALTVMAVLATMAIPLALGTAQMQRRLSSFSKRVFTGSE